MPLYSYQCPVHGTFSKIRSVKDREEPIPCPECNAQSEYTPTFETSAPVFKGGGFHCTDYGVKEGKR